VVVREEHGHMLAVLPSHMAGCTLYLPLLPCTGKGWLVQAPKNLCHHLYFQPIPFSCISGFLVFAFLKELGASSFRRRTGEREPSRQGPWLITLPLGGKH